MCRSGPSQTLVTGEYFRRNSDLDEKEKKQKLHSSHAHTVVSVQDNSSHRRTKLTPRVSWFSRVSSPLVFLRTDPFLFSTSLWIDKKGKNLRLIRIGLSVFCLSVSTSRQILISTDLTGFLTHTTLEPVPSTFPTLDPIYPLHSVSSWLYFVYRWFKIRVQRPLCLPHSTETGVSKLSGLRIHQFNPAVTDTSNSYIQWRVCIRRAHILRLVECESDPVLHSQSCDLETSMSRKTQDEYKVYVNN